MAYGESHGHCHDPKMCCEAVRSAILATAWVLVLVCAVIQHASSFISQVIGWEGWVFCTSQDIGWEERLRNDL